MDYRNTLMSVGSGIGIALLFSLMNGLSTYLFKGDTISEAATSKFGGQ